MNDQNNADDAAPLINNNPSDRWPKFSNSNLT